MNVSGPGAGIHHQGIPTEARIESPQPQDETVSRTAPVDEAQSSQRSRSDSSGRSRDDAPGRVDITV